jgi:hypothetical protein
MGAASKIMIAIRKVTVEYLSFAFRGLFKDVFSIGW